MCISSAQYRYVPGPGGGEPEALVGGVLDTRVNRGQELHQTLPVRHHMHLETRSSGKCNKFKKILTGTGTDHNFGKFCFKIVLH